MLVIGNIWALVGVDDEGNESFPAVQVKGGHMIPLIATDADRLSLIKQVGQKIANEGHVFELREYTTYQVIAKIEPQEG